MLRRIASVFVWSATVLGASSIFWVIFGACVGCFGCVEHPVEPPEPISTVYASWDPLACGSPHRVVIELEDDGGAPLDASVPCNRGGAELEATHWGRYSGRVFAWSGDGPGTEKTSPAIGVALAIDATIVHWPITPPGAPR